MVQGMETLCAQDHALLVFTRVNTIVGQRGLVTSSGFHEDLGLLVLEVGA